MSKRKRRTTEELIQELRDFKHYESADRMEYLQRQLDTVAAEWQTLQS